jgi:hypothetical protein
MRSVLKLLSVYGAIACEANSCDVDEESLLQAKSSVRRHKQTQSAEDLLQSLQHVAKSFTEGSGVSMSPDQVNAALGTATSALETMFPAIAEQHRLAQQQIDDAERAVEACHDSHGGDVRSALEATVATHYSEKEQCEDELGEAMQAEATLCEGIGENTRDCPCNDARTAVEHKQELCASITTSYELAYCELQLLCDTLHGCHEREVGVYEDVRADVEAAMTLRQQEYITAMQSQCLLQLIMGALTTGTPIPDDPLTACADVSVADLVINFPTLPGDPADCPTPGPDAPQCGGGEPVTCLYRLPTAWGITATSHWDGNYAPDQVKTHGGNPWHTGTANTLPQDLSFDAGDVVTLSGIATAHPTGWGGSAMQAYTFSSSDNGVDFTEVVSGTGQNLGNQARQEIEFSPVSARYWKLHVTSNYGYGNYVTDQYVELKMCRPCEPFHWQLPSSWSVTASSEWDGNYAPSNVKEHGGRPWHTGRANSLPDDLFFDAGEEVTINGFATAHPAGWAGSAMQAYTFSTSDDGTHYSEVQSGTGENLAHGARQEISLDRPVTSRYFRLHVTSNYGYGNYVTDQYVEFSVAQVCVALPDNDGPCPSGWRQAGEVGADIGGCGLQSCGERYALSTARQCADQCSSRADCRGFNWAPRGADRNHADQDVCTMYNSDTPTSRWTGSDGSYIQVFCVRA